MNEYQKVALETRKKVSKLTLDQQRELLKLYEGAIDNLASKATSARDKSLTRRWSLDYKKSLQKEVNKLHEEIRRQTVKAIELSAELATFPEEWFYKEMFNKIDFDIGPHFTQMFSETKKEVVENIVSGGLYKDHKTLSSRIWNISGKFDTDVQYMVNQALLEGKSALELARDLEKFVNDPAKRGFNWGKIYPNLRNTKVDYNAQRLARTSINHAYQTSTIKSSSMNPFVEGIEWQSAMIHGRTCQLCMDRDGQIFSKDSVPLDHPQGLCTMLPYITKSLDEVADELRDWLDGSNNSNLDDWYQEYGDYFAFKNVANSYNFGDTININSGIIDNIKDDLKMLSIKGKINIPPRSINSDKLSFDDEHINKVRNHNVTKQEAIDFVKEAQVSITKWNGQFENYYGVNGVAYVNIKDKLIRTCYKSEEFKGESQKIKEVLLKHERGHVSHSE